MAVACLRLLTFPPLPRGDHAIVGHHSGITPDMPHNFKAPPLNGNRYRDRAEECRALAEHLTDPNCRRIMLELAATYDHAANRVDNM